MVDRQITVEVAIALPGEQRVMTLTLAQGTFASDAIKASGLADAFHADLPDPLPVGIYGRLLEDPATYQLQEGDRIELYRPLLIDPKEARRQRAEKTRKRFKKT